MIKDSGLQRVQSTQKKLNELGFRQQFWISGNTILLKNEISALLEFWNQEHLQPRNTISKKLITG